MSTRHCGDIYQGVAGRRMFCWTIRERLCKEFCRQAHRNNLATNTYYYTLYRTTDEKTNIETIVGDRNFSR